MIKINYVGRLFKNTYRVDLHTHDLWEVVYYTKGSGFVDINNETLPFEKNDIYIIPPNTPHSDYSQEGFRNYYYTFHDLEVLRSTAYMKFKDSENMDFYKILRQLYHEYHLKRNNSGNIVNSLYDVLNQYMISFSQSSPRNEYVDQVIDEIIYNFSNAQFDIRDILDSIPLNVDYFRKLFISQTGMSPLKLLIYKRISYAKQLLISQEYSKLPLKEIAWRSGFSDYYYFSRIFKKETGVCPKNWYAHTRAEQADSEENEKKHMFFDTPAQ